MCAAIATADSAIEFKEEDDDFLEVAVNETDDFVEVPTAVKIDRDQRKERKRSMKVRVAAACAENVMQGTLFSKPAKEEPKKAPANPSRKPVTAQQLRPYEIVQHRYICLVTQGANILMMARLLANTALFPSVAEDFLSLDLSASSLRDFRIQATNEEIAVIREVAERIPSALPSRSSKLHVQLAAAKILTLYKGQLLKDMKAASSEYVTSCTERYQEQVLRRVLSTVSK